MLGALALMEAVLDVDQQHRHRVDNFNRSESDSHISPNPHLSPVLLHNLEEPLNVKCTLMWSR